MITPVFIADRAIAMIPSNFDVIQDDNSGFSKLILDCFEGKIKQTNARRGVTA